MALMTWLEQSLGSRDGGLLAPHLTERTLPNNTVLYAQGEASDRLTLVVEGTLEASRDHDGSRLVFAEVTAGQWLGEIGFVDGGASTATVTAKGNTTIAEIEREQLSAMLASDPKAANVLMSHVTRQLADRLRRGTDQVMAHAGNHEWRMEPAATRSGFWARLLGGFIGGGAQ